MAEIFCISKQIKRSFDRLDFQIIKSIFIDCFIYGNNSVIIRFISELYLYTVGENIIAIIKIRNNYGAIQTYIFPICDSNIRLFSFAPYLVISLPTLP